MFEKKNKKRFEFSLSLGLVVALAAIIWVAYLSGIFITFQSNLTLNEKIAEAKEAERPADISIVILQESSCQDCSNLTPLLDAIKKENVKINSEKTVEITSPEGMELINKYSITKVPALVISGEIEKEANLKAMWPQLGEVKEDTFILRQVGAPYVLIDSGDVIGRIKWVMLTDTSCTECYDVANHEIILKQFGVPTQDRQVISSQLSDGKELIAKYKIKLVPTIILTGDVGAYPSLINVWSQVGTIEEDGAYIFREGVKQMGIYKDLTTNEIIKPTTN